MHMLRLLISASALAILSGAAVAADLPPPPIEPAAPPMMSPTPIAYNWSGFYLGAHGGWGFGDGAFDDGAVVGGQVGINWQWGTFVVGVEGDASWADLGEADMLASIRARAGLPLDQFLLYVTAGAGFADDLGWVAGGGVEFALTDAVSLGVEYLHYDADDSVGVVRGRVNWRFNTLVGG
jgi:outer membrane immunogenic protein